MGMLRHRSHESNNVVVVSLLNKIGAAGGEKLIFEEKEEKYFESGVLGSFYAYHPIYY
jgi:hypothetical protein